MAETLDLTLSGLWNNPYPFSAVPPGALSRADDVVIDKPNVAESRRGQKKYGAVDNVPVKEFEYKSTLLVNHGDKIAYDSDDNGTFVNYTGSFDPPQSGIKIRSFEGNENFYITTSLGIKKLDSVTSQFRQAGAPKALDGVGVLVSPGFMPDQVQVAYRMVWGYRDANDNEIIGPPSQRLVMINDTGENADVQLTYQIPDTIDTTWFYRVFRSGSSAGVSSVPDDELQQVKEGIPTSAEISAGFFTFTDIVPNSLRGAKLYTDPSQEGILRANEAPPYALDITLFRNSAFYANTKSKQRYIFSLVTVGDNTLGGSFGYQTNSGDTHTDTTIDALTKAAAAIIQDLTYTADAAGVAGNDIAITYTVGGTAGAEVVTVTDNNISVQIETGVSTATQIKTAVDGNGSSAALVDVTVSGTGSNPQVAAAQTFLEDGFDTTYLNVGMRVVGTGITSDTRIVSIDSASSITVDLATTATATVSIEFQDVFRIDSVEFFAASTSDFPNNQFKAILSGTPASNIEDTSMELIQAINQSPLNTSVYAYYESGPTDLPGLMLIEERAIGGVEFSITSTNGESFNPVLANTGTENVSDNDAAVNRVAFSKLQQPEAVPLLSYLTVGSENFEITRIITLRDAIFVFKPDEAIFRITGTSEADFTVSLFDSSQSIRAPECATVLNNEIIAFTDQNLISISDSGSQKISVPIESTLLQISSDLYPNFETGSFAYPYESDNKYIFYTVTNIEDNYPTQAFVYNKLTNTYTRWPMSRSCGIVLKRDNKMYLGNPDDNYIYQERKNFDRYDYCDAQIDLTIVSSSEATIVLSDTTGLAADWLIKQGGAESVITEVVDSTTITVEDVLVWAAGAAIGYEPITKDVSWLPNSSDNPGILKHFSECTVIFSDASFNKVDIGFQTNLSDDFEFVTVSELIGLGWGLFEWGNRPWGAPGGRPEPVRTYVPLEKQRCSWLNFRVRNNEVFSNFSLAGISAQFNRMSSRFR